MSYIDELNTLKQKLKNGEISTETFRLEKRLILDKAEQGKYTNASLGILKLYVSTIKKIITFKGRANRSEVWLFMTVNWFISIVLKSLSFTSPALDFNNNIFLSLLFSILLSFIGFSLWVRRFHDFNKSGLYSLLPLIIMLISLPLMIIFIGAIPFIIASIASFIWFLFYLFKKGTSGENKYGPAPKTNKSVVVFNWILSLALIPIVCLFLIASLKTKTTDFQQNLFLEMQSTLIEEISDIQIKTTASGKSFYSFHPID